MASKFSQRLCDRLGSKWSVTAIAVVMAVGACMYPAANWLHARYRISIDLSSIRCLPERVYLVKIDNSFRPQRGEVVAFKAPHGLMLPQFDGKIIAKLVAGVPGDRVLIKNDRAYVNGQFIGELILNGKLGKSPGAFDRDEIVPEGKLFVIGTLPRSYDGRYWGFLNQDVLIGHVTPLL